MTEVEIKLPAPAPETARALLRRNGFRVMGARVFEANTLYDTGDLSLRARGHLLRLRLAGRKAILTFKGTPVEGPHKTREEIEFTAGSGAEAALLLDRLGYRPVFRYEKYRAEFVRPGEPGHATLDETPIGVYFELEGEPVWIDQTAARLGFGTQDYITDSYGRLYLRYCQERGIAPTNMVFTQG